MRPDRVVPASTYRVQLSSNFTLDDLTNQVPYLSELGITDVYLSPIFTAQPGSPHGYDIVDHTTINPELGGCEGWRKLCSAVRAQSMGLILDVVPNHMAANPVHNMLWRQVLADGPSSPASRYFDVDWRPLTGLIRDKVLLPVLEEPYGAALLQGTVRVERAGDDVRVRCGGLHLPLASNSIDRQISDEAIDTINADPQRLHDVLENQHYRLAYWKAANDEINYRRFFDVNELIAIRPEQEDVFIGSHRLVLRLAQEDVVHGLRIDHVDGLLEPSAYLRRLRTAAEETGHEPLWIVVEKILDRSEALDPAWPIEGTTGYDALNVINRLFVSGRGVRVLRHFYQKLIDEPAIFRDISYRSKRLVMEHTLRSGLTLLAHAIKRVADASWTTRDITLNALSAALVEFIASMPVYRTYLGNGGERRGDREAVEQAFSWAVRRNASGDLSALLFIRSLMLDPADAVSDPALRRARKAAVTRLQQYTSGVYAKGVEDTAYYRDNTLLALNEVGGDPGGPAGTLPEFHRFNEQRARHWPYALTATSTHDTKLSEDTRIRIASLSMFTREWTTSVSAWRSANAPFRQDTSKGSCPDVNDEYRVYQVLVGLWPADDGAGTGAADAALVERMLAFMRKAVREAKVHTSWLRVDEEYETALERFVLAIMTDDAAGGFRCGLRAMVQAVQSTSACHSMSQLVLKCLMPGVPDIYQGDEAWALFITDPDNRQRVPFDAHRSALHRLLERESIGGVRATSAGDVFSADLKRYVTARLLHFRRDHRRLMTQAGYVPIRASGVRASALVAFRRSFEREHVIVAVPRLVERAAIAAGWPTGPGFWGDTELRVPSRVRQWVSPLTGDTFSLENPARAKLTQLADTWPWVVLYGVE